MTLPTTLLRLDTSVRLQGSTSRQLADAVERAWRQAHPHGQVLHHDLAQHPLPHLSAAMVEGFYAAPDALTTALRTAIAQSDQLVAELLSAHTVLISAPIYNFAIPSTLKAWIDHVVRMGHTVAYDGQQFTGLVTRPRAVLALGYGAGGYDGPMQAMDHVKPYLMQLLGFLGLRQIDVLRVEGTNADPPAAQAATATALAQAARLFAHQG